MKTNHTPERPSEPYSTKFEPFDIRFEAFIGYFGGVSNPLFLINFRVKFCCVFLKNHSKFPAIFPDIQ